MQDNSFSNDIYGSWKDKQIEKYSEIYKEIKEYLKDFEKALDIGVGRAWLWEYLSKKEINFGDIVGVEVSEDAVGREKNYIDYFYVDGSRENLGLEELGEEKFDLIVAFDSIHLVNYGGDLPELLREGGLMLQSVPLKFEDDLKLYPGMKLLEKGRIGKEEVDRYVLQKKI